MYNTSLPTQKSAAPLACLGNAASNNSIPSRTKRPSLSLRTALRIANTHKLVHELSTRAMRANEIAHFLEISRSGARKYIRTLRDADLIEIERNSDGRCAQIYKAEYRLSSDKKRVYAFLSDMALTKYNHGNRKVGARISGTYVARTVHILSDDKPYAVRAHRSPARRDPLVAALFGPAQAQET